MGARQQHVTAELDLESRVKLAANPATPPVLLAGLAIDVAVTVRAAVALNPSVPDGAELQLAADADERVRLLLARKLSAALPGLSGASRAELRERTLKVLSSLVHDEAVRIRTVIAAAVAGLPDVPHALVLALAMDRDVPVSEPVLRLSPLLSSDDLLCLLADPPHSLTAAAIACRPNLPAEVADAIAASAQSPAICTLLANGSAAIREGTLDALIARAVAEPAWHAPLVRRPRLPDHAARALSEIVAGHLLGELAARTELSSDTLAAIRQRLACSPAPPAGGSPPTDADMMDEARRLDDRGALGEPGLLACLRHGENRMASAMLAVAADVPIAVVNRALSLRSAKGLVSLVWKAGFSPQAITPVQAALGQVGPATALVPTRSGGFPLTVEEMCWQLDFLAASCR